ncbi:MAG: signal peptidase I [bacterium]|nr:signal peptidase I [bacterium]
MNTNQDKNKMEQENAADITVPVDVTAKKPKEKDDAVELLKAMAFAAAIALLIRSFLFEPFNIPSGSMFPSLLVGDYLFVKKWTYGYSQYSFPLDIIPMQGRMMEGMPERGDVAVFRQPKMQGVDYIKRIIGLPGDKIQVTEGRLYINDTMVPRQNEGTETYETEGRPFQFTRYIETLPNGVKHYIYEISDHEALDNTPEYIVPEGYYFAMGDNRDQSQDSRVEAAVGPVPAKNLIGPASFIFFSTEGIGDKCVYTGLFAAIQATGCKAVEYVKAIRYGRIFKSVNSI